MIDNAEEAIASLSSQIPNDRLAGARWFAANSVDSYRSAIDTALRREGVPWVRTALKIALSNAKGVETLAEDDSDHETDEFARLEREITQRVTGELTDQLLHEIRPLVGRVRLRALREFPNFEGSETEEVLRQIAQTLDGIGALGNATSQPRYEAFVLSDFLQLAAETCSRDLEQTQNPPTFQYSGPSPLVVVSDVSLLGLAVSNGIRNAIEASQDETSPVIVTWGSNSDGFWVSVIDYGDGLGVIPLQAMKIGVTTKSGHVGIGLSIASQAISSLEGTLSLFVGHDGLTHFDLACPLVVVE